MKIEDALKNRLDKSVDALVKASIKEIDQWIRDGLTLDDILQRLRTLRLSSAQSAQLKAALEGAMNDIVDARGSIVDELTGADINVVKAASQLSFAKMKDEVRTSLIPTVQKAIAAESGPTVLMHQLRQMEFSRPKTLAYTSLAQFNNGLTIATGEASGVEKYLWDGPAPIPTSHELCKLNAGKMFTLDELDSMDNGTGMPVRTTLGGFGCRHNLTAVVE